MWTGHPNDATVPIYAEKWGIEPSREAIFQFLNDDCRWITADSGYHHPEGRPAIDPALGTERHTLSAAGCFAEAETVADIEKYRGRILIVAILQISTGRWSNSRIKGFYRNVVLFLSSGI